ncbi:MAG: type II toxin-antitoxin system HicB family antitoxin [Verrucomicrobiales bacterium]|nr:type II toxin-antitoxin system HicB family antitoxin [Verrucomicrobiales bacterium]
MMTYKGYSGSVRFDDEAEIFHGEIIGLRDVVTFQGNTVDDLKQAFHDSIDDYLDFCEGRGEQADKPYSGKFLLRVDPLLHRRLAELSANDGESLNNWIASRLGELTNQTDG